MVEILGIDCRDVLMAALCPIIALIILEIIWNATEKVTYGPAVSGFFWVIKLCILGYAGFVFVNGDIIKSRLLGGR